MDSIILRKVKTHNLKNLDLDLTHRKLFVITGVSGSGKSSLAFDTLYAEGQRRYVESLSAYARQFLERMEKPDVENVQGIPPAIAIEAKNIITNARSTVGTQTEINDYLRLLFARIGQTYCDRCGEEVRHTQPAQMADHLMAAGAGQEVLILFNIVLGKGSKKYLKENLDEIVRQGFSEFFINGKIVSAGAVAVLRKKLAVIPVCADRVSLTAKNRKRLIDSIEAALRFGRGEIEVRVQGKVMRFSEGFCCFSCGKTFREPTPNLFSFNNPLGACPVCQGFGRVMTLDWGLIVPDVSKTIFDGAIEPWTKPSTSWEFQQLLKFCRVKKIPVNKPWKTLASKQKQWILQGCPDADFFSVSDFFDYLEKKRYKMHIRIFLSRYRCFIPCTACAETRLKPEALSVKIQGKTIYDIQCLSIDRLQDYLEGLTMTDAERERVEPIYLELKNRVRFIKEVGLGYLSLSRLSRTLSGGEVQRIHLATSLGSALVDTLYVLDEPSVGLHERDNRLLIQLLKNLRDLGNTVVVVEHDKTMIEAADEIIDLGPGGGEKGGRLLFQGDVSAIHKAEGSLTGEYLSGRRHVKRRTVVTAPSGKSIVIKGACEHNLKHIDVEIPVGKFVVITGVSGSGKSTLLYEILYRNYLRYRGRQVQDLGKVDTITGLDGVDEIVMVDQTPIGRSPRSNPATYLKAYDEIRKIFAEMPEAKRQGYSPGFFSFNVKGGRCDSCEGDGRIKVEMHFLADVFVTCETCHGKRFKDEILKLRYRGKNIAEVLEMTVEEAMEFFSGEKALEDKLSVLLRIGLSYLRLGQPATTLSGGEAQRLKLAIEMAECNTRRILYLFDEPTTGLHYHDIHYLMEAFDELIARGHSIIVIEHHMEVIRSADYIIDLGPEGGDGGGTVVYAGPTAGILDCSRSITGQFLRKHLEAS